ASGLHPSTVSRHYTRVMPMVYVRGEPSTMTRCQAVALWRPDAVLRHRSAAYLRGWTTEPAVLDATVPRAARLRPPPWLRLHRRTLDPHLVDEVETLPCTTTAQTMLDCLAVLPRAEAELLIDERLSFGLDPASLHCLLARFPGRRGNAELARQVRLAVAKFASEPERALGRALHRLGLRLDTNAQVGRFVCDFVDWRSRTIIEVDGREFHSAAEVFSNDRRRQNALVLDGWLVLRYSAFDVLAAPDRIASEIVSVIRRRRKSRR
ncbi:MAG: endonuclease domain-containing protein, partial [Rhodococcus sp. (in: high G+C Gram-positive bacteria)]